MDEPCGGVRGQATCGSWVGAPCVFCPRQETHALSRLAEVSCLGTGDDQGGCSDGPVDKPGLRQPCLPDEETVRSIMPWCFSDTCSHGSGCGPADLAHGECCYWVFQWGVGEVWVSIQGVLALTFEKRGYEKMKCPLVPSQWEGPRMRRSGWESLPQRACCWVAPKQSWWAVSGEGRTPRE